MAPMAAILLALAALAGPAAAARSRGATGAERSRALLQEYGKALDEGRASDTPVTRAVNLLKEMQGTLQKEMKEDEELYDKLACWCNTNEYEKDESISTSGAKISELSSTIESLAAKSEGLKTSIKELEDEVSANKKSLDEATALREKQQQEFHGSEVDSIQAIENLKAALEVLSKHHTSAPESTVGGGAIFKSEKDSWESLLAVDTKEQPWSTEHTVARMTSSLDDFMRRNGFDMGAEGDAAAPERRATPKFLQHEAAAGEWTTDDAALVKRALKSASAFMQAHHRDGYYPAYQSQSGEIYGLLKQLKEEMESDLSESQKREQAHAANFAELRAAKTSEIQNGEKMAEKKEDELATTVNNLAEAKEDLGQEEASLSADQKFMVNLKKTCADSSQNFQERKAARLEELKAVSEAVSILTADVARDTMSRTYSFLQGSSGVVHREQKHRSKAAKVLRDTAKALKEPQLSIMATRVELDAFTRVKKAIDDMVAMLKVQQADEVKKSDYCKAELQQNEMTTAQTEDRKADLEAKSGSLASSIQALEEGIATAKKQIANLQLELQRASEDRQKENHEFQKTVADQTVTQEVLKKALDRLATYYDQESLVQKSSQTPPVPQMEYKPSKSSEGVMQLLEKLIQEAKALTAESVKSESEAQAAYEQTVVDTNAAVGTLQDEVVSKTRAKAGDKKDKMQTDSDISDTVSELEGLAKYNSELHGECDYLLKNFAARQEARSQEIEALQQAKQILSGASLS